MRVISGTARGTKLYSLDGMETRPTLDRVKESLFNILQEKLQDAVIIDLFAGSGALGIEAISRGAKKVYFCDKARQAIQIVQKNLEKTRMQEKAVVIYGDYRQALMKIKQKADLIFLDPPYDTKLALEAIEEIIILNLINEDGFFILETDQEEKTLQQLEDLNLNLNVYDIRRYGRVKLIWINRKG